MRSWPSKKTWPEPAGASGVEGELGRTSGTRSQKSFSFKQSNVSEASRQLTLSGGSVDMVPTRTPTAVLPAHAPGQTCLEALAPRWVDHPVALNCNSSSIAQWALTDDPCCGRMVTAGWALDQKWGWRCPQRGRQRNIIHFFSSSHSTNVAKFLLGIICWQACLRPLGQAGIVKNTK